MSAKKKHVEVVWCCTPGCFKRFSYLDWAEPAKALQEHQLSGECKGTWKA